MDCGLDGLTFTEPSHCQPQFADDCDLQVIVRRFLKTGQLPDAVVRTPLQNVASLPDSFQELMDQTVAARQTFEQLSLEERNRFNNDPELWLASFEAVPETVVEDKVEDPKEETPKE